MPPLQPSPVTAALAQTPLGRAFGASLHPAATAPMRARALAAVVGPGREFAQTRLSFLCLDVAAARTNVLAYDEIRQPTILVQVR